MATTPATGIGLPSRWWAELTTTDFTQLQESGAASQLLAVLPLAATEQHGPHLPLGVDSLLLDGIIAAALVHLPTQVPALFLPPQNVGRSVEHIAFPGTLTLPFEALLHSWLALGECVAGVGVRKLVLLNSHGGNVSSMDIVGRELRARCGLQIWLMNTFQLALPPELQALFTPEELRFGAHAGALETALMLALAPHLVRPAALQNFASASQSRHAAHPLLAANGVKLAWATQDLNLQGAAGDTRQASAEKGRALLAAYGLALAGVLETIAQL
ncbi:MAG: creatininase family protein [Burkholderiales bacterium]